jgi:uncharacterized protein (TIGR03435 family)
MKLLLTVFLGTALACAQSPPFDVASVKSDPWRGNGSVGVTVKGNTLTADHVCLDGLVEFAYNLRDDHLSGGPSWAKCGLLATSDLYQVIAKAPGDAPPSTEQFRIMLQTLLAERFQLQIHHIEKEFPTYNLVIAPHGPKMKESAADAKFSENQDARLNHGRSIHATVTHISMERFVEHFGRYSGRPLFDHTGLSGFYDLELTWDTEGPTAAPPDAPVPELFGQTLATALEKQLGLKLESSTAPIDTVVIDRAEKPSAN